MNYVTGCQHIRSLLGVYVLGAIDPAERAQVDAHLPGCPECREELAGLAGLPALLGRVNFDEAARIAGLDAERPAPSLAGPDGTGLDGTGLDGTGLDDAHDVVPLTPLLDRMARRRRMNRWRGVVAAAAVVVAAAGAAVGITETSGGVGAPAVASGPQHWQTVRATDPASHVQVVVKYAGEPWGTNLDTEVYGIQAGTTCEFWVMGADGKRWLAGSWTVASTWKDTSYPGSSSVPVNAVRGFEITSGQRVLVHLNAT